MRGKSITCLASMAEEQANKSVCFATSGETESPHIDEKSWVL
jgi:hypothetical protein